MNVSKVFNHECPGSLRKTFSGSLCCAVEIGGVAVLDPSDLNLNAYICFVMFSLNTCVLSITFGREKKAAVAGCKALWDIQVQ